MLQFGAKNSWRAWHEVNPLAHCSRLFQEMVKPARDQTSGWTRCHGSGHRSVFHRDAVKRAFRGFAFEWWRIMHTGGWRHEPASSRARVSRRVDWETPSEKSRAFRKLPRVSKKRSFLPIVFLVARKRATSKTRPRQRRVTLGVSTPLSPNPPPLWLGRQLKINPPRLLSVLFPFSAIRVLPSKAFSLPRAP